MKKFFVFFILLHLCSLANAQDTVRYGDPWYAFNPLPSVSSVSQNAVNRDSYVLLANCGTGRTYLGFQNNDYYIYGIAVVMDSIPGPEWNYIVTLLRGMDYHFEPGNPYHNSIIIDSLYQEDTIMTWADPLVKQCRFEYFYGYDATSNIYKDSVAKNCFEFYFDTPVKLNNAGLGVLSDTFWVGVNTCHELIPGFDFYTELAPFIPYTLHHSDFSTPMFRYHVGTGYAFYYLPSINYGAMNTPRLWGGIFPIIERRCSVPRRLALSADSLTASWRSDTDAELFQLAVCSDMTEPDDGLLFTTTATSHPLPPFHRDSTYRLYLRKMCDFRQDSVWSDWSAPLVIAPRPTEGIGEVENAKWTIDITPNPATKQVHIATNFILTQVEIFDEQGRLSYTLPVSGLKADLDVSSWPRGTYLLRILTPAGPTTKKLLIQ